MTLRAARPDDIDRLLALWALLFDDDDDDAGPWREAARSWFGQVVDDRAVACFPVVEAGGEVVACVVGTLEPGVPNPFSPTGRTVRLSNLVTLPEHRGRGFGTALVEAVVDWARSVGADRVDLSATPDGQRLYERCGFVPTSAPRLKLVLGAEPSPR